MNVTVPAQEQETADQEVSSLHCEATHENTDCTGRVVGYTQITCEHPIPRLSCFAAVRWFLDGIESDVFWCRYCGRDCAGCWSVVMLP